MKLTKNMFSQEIYPGRYEFLIKHYKKGKILDIGNIGGIRGTGISNSFHAKFQSTVAADSIVYGLDLFEPLADSQTAFNNQTTANIEEGIPFEPKFFDTVYMGQVLEHVKNPYFVLCEVHRVLQDSGIFIFDVPNPYSVSRILSYALLKKEDLGDPTHICFLTPASILKLLDLSGYSLQELATDWKEKMPWLPKNLQIGIGSHLLLAANKK
ncbi:methyltransferase domain-containing protein [Lyngbya aestuarii]|uniref:methyltransferase domain-containing protein n=1 Tax=Lyngbya aestuarii TaxID=118322 RepID=UPI00403D6E1E